MPGRQETSAAVIFAGHDARAARRRDDDGMTTRERLRHQRRAEVVDKYNRSVGVRVRHDDAHAVLANGCRQQLDLPRPSDDMGQRRAASADPGPRSQPLVDNLVRGRYYDAKEPVAELQRREGVATPWPDAAGAAPAHVDPLAAMPLTDRQAQANAEAEARADRDAEAILEAAKACPQGYGVRVGALPFDDSVDVFGRKLRRPWLAERGPTRLTARGASDIERRDAELAQIKKERELATVKRRIAAGDYDEYLGEDAVRGPVSLGSAVPQGPALDSSSPPARRGPLRASGQINPITGVETDMGGAPNSQDIEHDDWNVVDEDDGAPSEQELSAHRYREEQDGRAADIKRRQQLLCKAHAFRPQGHAAAGDTPLAVPRRDDGRTSAQRRDSCDSHDGVRPDPREMEQQHVRFRSPMESMQQPSATSTVEIPRPQYEHGHHEHSTRHQQQQHHGVDDCVEDEKDRPTSAMLMEDDVGHRGVPSRITAPVRRAVAEEVHRDVAAAEAEEEQTMRARQAPDYGVDRRVMASQRQEPTAPVNPMSKMAGYSASAAAPFATSTQGSMIPKRSTLRDHGHTDPRARRSASADSRPASSRAVPTHHDAAVRGGNDASTVTGLRATMASAVADVNRYVAAVHSSDRAPHFEHRPVDLAPKHEAPAWRAGLLGEKDARIQAVVEARRERVAAAEAVRQREIAAIRNLPAEKLSATLHHTHLQLRPEWQKPLVTKPAPITAYHSPAYPTTYYKGTQTPGDECDADHADEHEGGHGEERGEPQWLQGKSASQLAREQAHYGCGAPFGRVPSAEETAAGAALRPRDANAPVAKIRGQCAPTVPSLAGRVPSTAADQRFEAMPAKAEEQRVLSSRYRHRPQDQMMMFI